MWIYCKIDSKFKGIYVLGDDFDDHDHDLPNSLDLVYY